MNNSINWRSLPVYRSGEYENLVEQFCSTKSNGISDNVVFSNIKDFMVFAALVGFQLGRYKEIENKSNAVAITLDTYSTTGLDSYIYLMALSRHPQLDILKDENLKQAIGIFEAYCNGGLEQINKWVFDNIGRHPSVDILFNQTLEYLISNE